MRAASIPARLPARSYGSKRLLGLAGDERLVNQIRCGNEVAFEVAFERHGPAILAFCRHMLGSPDEAEDAVQHTFAAAYRDLQRDSEREIALKPWLFAIARNRCLSLLRSRREHTMEGHELATAGLDEQVERRAELRQLLTDLGELPEEQRAALLLAEAGDLSHAQVAQVLGCEVHRVKALVHRARTGLIARRVARETPCEQIREQLANLRRGSLRRTELRLHLRECAGCRAYREHVKQQRRMLAAALPVAPTLALKSSVLAAVGIGGGATGGGLAAALGGTIGAATLTKVAVVGVIAGGGALAGDAVIDSQPEPVGTPAAPATRSAPRAAGNEAVSGPSQAPAGRAGQRRGERLSTAVRDKRDVSLLRGERGAPAASGRDGATAPPPGQAKPSGGRKRGHARVSKPKSNRGRGPIEAPPASTPVKRGPVAPKPKPAKAAPRGQVKTPAAPPAPTQVSPEPKGTGPKK